MITGMFDHNGRPVISVWVQAVRSPLEKTGLKIPVDFVIATGAKRTILGAADAARLGITPQDARAPENQAQVYWQHPRPTAQNHPGQNSTSKTTGRPPTGPSP